PIGRDRNEDPLRVDCLGVRLREPGLAGSADARKNNEAASLQAEVVAANRSLREDEPLVQDRARDRFERRFLVGRNCWLRLAIAARYPEAAAPEQLLESRL